MRLNKRGEKMNAKHTPGAIRAARKIYGLKSKSEAAQIMIDIESERIAAIIDRETHCGEMLEALERLLGAFITDSDISPEMPIRISVETNGAAIAQARAVLAKVKGE